MLLTPLHPTPQNPTSNKQQQKQKAPPKTKQQLTIQNNQQLKNNILDNSQVELLNAGKRQYSPLHWQPYKQHQKNQVRFIISKCKQAIKKPL